MLDDASGSPQPALDLLTALQPSLAPCIGFTTSCQGSVRWEPEAGHIPRGWIGATASSADVRLVLVTAEPGDPADGEHYTGLDGDGAMRHYHGIAYDALERNSLLRRGRPAPFHLALRRILDLCWPHQSFQDQMRRTWITPAVLCSAPVSGGKLTSAVERACATHLRAQLEVLRGPFIVALGGKAHARLKRAGIVSHAIAQHPSARPNTDPEASWVNMASHFRAWILQNP